MKLKNLRLIFCIGVVLLFTKCPGNSDDTSNNDDKNKHSKSNSGGGKDDIIQVSYESNSYNIDNKYKNILESKLINYKLGKNSCGENILHTLRHYVCGSFTANDVDKKVRDKKAAELVEELASKLPKDKLKQLLNEKSGNSSNGPTPLENVTQNSKAEPGIEKFYDALKKYSDT